MLLSTLTVTTLTPLETKASSTICGYHQRFTANTEPILALIRSTFLFPVLLSLHPQTGTTPEVVLIPHKNEEDVSYPKI